MSDRSYAESREKLNWRVDADVYQRFCAEYGPNADDIRRHIERAMREYANLDDMASVESRLVDLLNSLDAAKEKSERRSDFSMGDTTETYRRISSRLKMDFQRWTHESLESESYGYALSRALREYLLCPRSKRIHDKLDRLEHITDDIQKHVETTETEDSHSKPLPAEYEEKLNESADRMDAAVGDTVRARAGEMVDMLLSRRETDEIVDELDVEIIVGDHPGFDGEPSAPTQRKYKDLIINTLDLRPHPKHHENHAHRFPDGNVDPELTEYVFPERFREIMETIYEKEPPSKPDTEAEPDASDPDSGDEAETIDVAEKMEMLTEQAEASRALVDNDG